MTVVFDASTVLAILKDEPGADLAIGHARGALLSAVNLVEVRSKLFDAVTDVDAAMAMLDQLEIVVVPFSDAQAVIAADLWPRVKGRNVSLADRACLALGVDRKGTVFTADSLWAELGLDLTITLIR
ncbi:hypothetical protein ASE75_04035 [Sphingomonas sp. Leaf17]|uniref:type II toxin-antitoxin system VapC family toxin n=1 Tax=Sphingomonas sp. Leaf17 TaxID=1735683 RepID=UPI0006FB5ED0|nr:type II toxin-antitoxin system VapC family toxin [Sphingomonas sp. Leaf17]KQM68032.1 hypothetical protein ASE75_04035 [Sphingomonas sp. Leaf17]